MGPVTLTHARIRLAQGDLRGARRILSEILRLDPKHSAAQRLLEELHGRRSNDRPAVPEESLDEPRAADVDELRARFRREIGRRDAAHSRERLRRLRAWLRRVDAGGPSRG